MASNDYGIFLGVELVFMLSCWKKQKSFLFVLFWRHDLKAWKTKKTKARPRMLSVLQTLAREKFRGVQKRISFKKKSIRDWYWSPTKLPMKSIKERKGRRKEQQNWGKMSWLIIINNQKTLWIPQPSLAMLLVIQGASISEIVNGSQLLKYSGGDNFCFKFGKDITFRQLYDVLKRYKGYISNKKNPSVILLFPVNGLNKKFFLSTKSASISHRWAGCEVLM